MELAVAVELAAAKLKREAQVDYLAAGRVVRRAVHLAQFLAAAGVALPAAGVRFLVAAAVEAQRALAVAGSVLTGATEAIITRLVLRPLAAVVAMLQAHGVSAVFISKRIKP